MIDLTKTTPTTTALLAISKERARQERLKQSGRFVYTCADPGMDEGDKLACLMEELGEVARNVLARKGLVTDGEKGSNALYKELCQVAAVATAWMEAL